MQVSNRTSACPEASAAAGRTTELNAAAPPARIVVLRKSRRPLPGAHVPDCSFMRHLRSRPASRAGCGRILFGAGAGRRLSKVTVTGRLGAPINFIRAIRKPRGGDEEDGK